MRTMPEIETERLRIRPFTPTDTDAVYHVNASIGVLNPAQSESEQREDTHRYVEWCALNHAQLAQLHQPPYGDRAVVLKATGDVIGLCGLVPYLDALGVFPYFGGEPGGQPEVASGRAFPEIGLFWAIAANQQGQGYATEVARALIHYAFTGLNLHHLIATTDYDNLASQRVMEKAGMRLEHNPFPEPPWLQLLGIIENR